MEIYTWENRGRKMETTEVGDGELLETEKASNGRDLKSDTERKDVSQGYKLYM